MEVIAIIGIMGSGKTLLMTKFLKDDYDNKREVFANYGLTFPFKKFNKELIESYAKDGGVYNCTMGIDELHVWFDSRNHASNSNKKFSYLVNQTRKREVDLIFTTQTIDQVEIRLRRAISTVIFPQIYVNNKMWKTNNKIPFGSKVDIVAKIVKVGQNPYFKVYENVQSYFKNYNTEETIDFE